MKNFLCKTRKDLKIDSNNAFTLAEVLITLGIIGIVASLTIPNLIQSYQERQMVTGLLKFNSTLQQAVQRWKQDIDCYSDASTCLEMQGLPDDTCSNFDQIAKFMRISKKKGHGVSSVEWLPSQTLDYYGNPQTGSYGGVSNASTTTCRYLTEDGMIFSMDVNPTFFMMWVDVNGKKLPNRNGRDTFPLRIGPATGRDISYFPVKNDTAINTFGLCGGSCNPENTDPTKYNGASPTAYVISNHKLPDFKALSQIVPGFKP